MSDTHNPSSGVGTPSDTDIEIQHIRMQLECAEAEIASLREQLTAWIGLAATLTKVIPP